MKRIIAIVLGLLISIPSMVEGASVLLKGSTSGDIVLKWLVAYNVIAAAASLGVVFAIWLKKEIAGSLSLVIAIAHFSVCLILVWIHFTSGEVATKSIFAMLIRTLIWIIIWLMIRRK